MNAAELLETIELAGGSLTLRGERILYAIPNSEKWLLNELKENRAALVDLLRIRQSAPPMPPGIRLLRWRPKDPPVAIVDLGVVTDVNKFATATLLQLKARLEGKDFLAGNWSLRQLLERLEQVGVEVEVHQGAT